MNQDIHQYMIQVGEGRIGHRNKKEENEAVWCFNRILAKSEMLFFNKILIAVVCDG